ncbi:MAG: hypothetical protein A3F31_05345 [Candidatus Levybacteria bacterium RIFCSPHIGHO2_12_FULL_38_12]|nr:MAG: hypothetical protein A2770_01120 [Candidatus Levybacteria bacterium RIFCSPHIGHO2_01_FULL_38_12]OGH23181.1 MAG: hypothetical protein A3F31_05345 [Candidatus Levybacteria bacterium RIFCSPHIGHO2_12_FULL_38_12]OGH33275.1 MAG: hypothetical protein A3A47_01375 [Candidatus Levybacteria bacterium RIFCSPLOWO2_01_FULL_37_20]OGH44842.1 MAG: hypothetical protein A3J14_02390 [Candidatus Levybacteria bacterium RIFCSPLOWO2_02_FULL_37_18]OGH51690.1 MAG: hypothetical protein A3G13_01915 [Candidatus Levy
MFSKFKLPKIEWPAVLNVLSLFSSFLFYYWKKRVLTASIVFEKNKNVAVRFFIMKRGRYNRPFLHITTMIVLAIGVFIAPFLADTYPVFSTGSSTFAFSTLNKAESITVDSQVFSTNVSQKPRDKIETYIVQKGDTLSTIAKKFDISVETIKWANDLTDDDLTVGDTLKILPVTGISHKVSKGDTVYTIAKKYDINPQLIVDFPFNEFANPETFSLVEGQIVIVPEGVKPSEKPVFRRQTYVVQGPISISSAGFTWPLRGEISQFAAWYHMALDITSPVGTPIVAAQDGKVVKSLIGVWDGGYGTSVMVDNGEGYSSLYAHLSGVSVDVGDTVVAGKTVLGWVGMTGRTTGPHVHFEISRNGVLVNPMSYLQ